MKRFYPLLIMLLAAAFSTALLYVKLMPIYGVALRLDDFFYKLNKNPLSKKVALVLVDEKSVNKFGRWPWDRRIVADGLKKLKEAKVIALDMVFSEKTQNSSDLYLSNTIESLGNVVCGFFLRPVATENPSSDIMDTLVDSSLADVPQKVPFASLPFAEVNILPITNACLLSGTFSAVADPDGLFRHYPLGFVFQGEFYPSLAVQALRVFLKKQTWIDENGTLHIGDRVIPTDETHMALLNFYRPSSYIDRIYSFVDVYQGKVPPSVFKGKLVFVGISEAGVTDIRATPIGLVPGPYLHVTFASNFLQNILLKRKFKWDAAAIFILSFLVLLASYAQSDTLRFSAYILFEILLFVAAAALYESLCVKVDVFYPTFSMTLSIIGLEGYSSFVKGKQTKFLKQAFSTYLSPALLSVLTKSPDKLRIGGEKREISVLFSDIRGFTSLSEKLEPETLVWVLNTYLEPMTDIVLKNDGTLDKYIGDAVMAIWNAPLDVENHAEKALNAALEMLSALPKINSYLSQRNLPEIKIGIGVNTGQAVVGNMGSSRRFDYTAIGDTVNLASRLEGLNKLYGTSLLFSQFTKEKVSFPIQGKYYPVEVDIVAVKGKEEPVKIYTLTDDKALAQRYEKALTFYKRAEFKRAAAVFKELSKIFPPASVMLKRCEHLIKEPPKSWDGVYKAKHK